jgi:hypothetical protein
MRAKLQCSVAAPMLRRWQDSSREHRRVVDTKAEEQHHSVSQRANTSLLQKHCLGHFIDALGQGWHNHDSCIRSYCDSCARKLQVYVYQTAAFRVLLIIVSINHYN